MIFLGAVALTLCALISSTDSATGAVDWCYHLSTCNDATWPTISADFCNGTRQSPININTSTATGNTNLTGFTFVNFDNTSALKQIKNTGKTIKVDFNSGVSVSGGDLSEAYDSLQFHLHWGNTSSVPGSEHTVDGKRYPMELHIVNLKSSVNGNVTEALNNPTGLAALGFFIEAMSGNETGKPESWKTLTNYLVNITEKDQSVAITSNITLDDLLPGVDRTKYYRYLGSLTTPTCNEVVVWTVFKESVKVSKDLIDLFSTMLHINDTSSPLMTNVYRNIQPDQAVTTQVESTSSASTTCYSLGLILLCLTLWRNY